MAMEEMALEKVHPTKAPYGYIRNKETGHLEIEPIESQIVKEIFNLCKDGKSTRGIATILKMKIEYTKIGDYKIPNLTLKNQYNGEINKYGRLRLHYLKENNQALYTKLLMANEL